MAMNMAGSIELPAERNAVWTALNDVQVLARCIPGCQELNRNEDESLSAVAKLLVGPVKATFKGRVVLSDMDAPNGYTITGEGQGGVAGSAKGGAKVGLVDGEEGRTILSYEVEAQVGGKIAQLGGRLINGAAKKYADEFFAKFAKEFAPDEASVSDANTPPAASEAMAVTS